MQELQLTSGQIIILIVLITIVVTVVLRLISTHGRWWSAQMFKCPGCQSETNFLTSSGLCQECEWEKIAKRRMEKTIGIGKYL